MTRGEDGQIKRTERMRNFSLGRVIFWLAMTPIFWASGLWNRVWLVSLLSIWALVETPFAAWRADDNPDAERMARMEGMLEEMLTAQGELLTSQSNIVGHLTAKPKPRTRTRST